MKYNLKKSGFNQTGSMSYCPCLIVSVSNEVEAHYQFCFDYDARIFRQHILKLVHVSFHILQSFAASIFHVVFLALAELAILVRASAFLLPFLNVKLNKYHDLRYVLILTPQCSEKLSIVLDSFLKM